MPIYILGINLSHDRSTCLLKDGQLVVAIAEERLDRIKHSFGRTLYNQGHRIGPKLLPWKGIGYCLDYCNIGLDDLDLIILDQAGPPLLLRDVAKEIPIKDKSKIRTLPHPSHHLAHAYSAYFCSPFNESAILIADNIGSYFNVEEENEGESGYYADHLSITELFKTISKARDIENESICLGRMYRISSLLLGFYHEKIGAGQLGTIIQYLDESGKTMGLAPYGEKRGDWPPFVRIKKDSIDYSPFLNWLKKRGLYPPKKVGDEKGRFKYLVRRLLLKDPRKELTQFHKDLAYAAQKNLEKGLIYLANRLYEKTKSKNLCLAGGVFLNSVANKKILDKTPFQNIFIQPAATDDGNAIGAAFYGWHHYLRKSKRFCMCHASLGRHYSDEEIESMLIQNGVIDFERLDEEELLKFTAASLAEGKIVGWMQGGAEFGPRALGHRSILADPRHPKMKDRLNQRVKFREGFRPYAPAVLEEYSRDFFDIKSTSPFMLLVASVKKPKRKEIPAVTHVDGTARLQTVNKAQNGLFYDLIHEFYKKTGIPMILNTSFNVRGEPIVETPLDALLCFLKTEMDLLILGSYVVRRELFSDGLMSELIPLPLVRVVSDEQKNTKYFHIDSLRQDVVNVTTEEALFLRHCKDDLTVVQIVQKLDQKSPKWSSSLTLNFPHFIRQMFRKRLIIFKTPYMKNINPSASSSPDFS
ncbi:MAG: hypothetical protein A3I75_00405 [Deltaproteobacteria bacterium RIFCSPLOWO2_02_FULL_50_16]|nr:MAG: hypothetical protein A3B79_05600 [Deltaproteobacteria bacterium RIFCSPHIGHO2_02_FULL_50_15]OGQ58508.1 MAG: hypothetical protein A3I75_00405 [Deltaproteobacteria bacterium RIFCSPLOWO2_02_FULL_50_16]OGQ67968.1 MAG: hypothetical protein A3F89_03575 [Deltaproteobacteria bacterium RIFCSPLOWO2_12_FULL_50_11]